MGSHEPQSGAFRDGMLVAIKDGGVLPERCVKCNAPASGQPIRWTFVDSDVGGMPTSTFSAIRHFNSRRTATVRISLCKWHRHFRSLVLWGSPVLMAFSVAVGVYANVAYPKPIPEFLVGMTIALFMAGILPLLVFASRPYFNAHVHEGQVWIIGAGTEFLESLPMADGTPRSKG
jgi:hypothetical protein